MKKIIKEHVDAVKEYCKAKPFEALAACFCLLAVIVFLA